MEIHDWKKWWHPLAVFLIPVLLTLGFIFYVSKYHPPKMFPVKGGHSVRR